MPLPSMKEQFAALIAAPSVSCTQASLDQSNRPVIDLLAAWLGDLGFAIDIQHVSPANSTCWPASAAAPVAWYWRGIAIPCRMTRRCGKPTRSS